MAMLTQLPTVLQEGEDSKLTMAWWVGVASLGLILGRTMPAFSETGRTVTLVVVIALVGAVTLGRRLAARGQLLITLLLFSFVLTGWRTETGFIVLEPWQVVLFFCFTSWGLESLKSRRFFLSVDWITVLALWVVVGTWLSVLGALDLPTWMKRTMKVSWLFGMYLYLVATVRRRADLSMALRICLLACAVDSLALIWQVLGRVAQAPGFESVDLSFLNGTFANTNEGATYLALFATLAVALRLFGVGAEIMPKRAFDGVLGMIVTAILLSGSRTALFAFGIISGGLYVLHHEGARMKRVILMGMLLTGVAALVVALEAYSNPFIRKAMATFGASGDPTYDAFVQSGTMVRLYMVDVFWSAFATSPIVGIGAANYGFLEALNLNLPAPPPGEHWGFSDADRYLGFSSHNGFMSWLAETGLVGFVPFVLSLVYAGGALRKLAKRSSVSTWWQACAMGLVGSVIAFAIGNLFGDFAVSEPRYWLLLAMASITLRLSVQPENSEEDRVLRTYRGPQRAES